MPIKNKERELVTSSENLKNLPDENLLFSPSSNLQINEENPIDVYTLSTRNDLNFSSLFKSQTNGTVDLTDAIFPNSARQVRYKSEDVDIENLKTHTFELYQLNLKKKEGQSNQLAFRDFTEIENSSEFKDSELLAKYNALTTEEPYRTSYINSHIDVSLMSNEAFLTLAEQSRMLITRILAFVKVDDLSFTSLLRYLRVLADPTSINELDIFVDSKEYFKKALLSCYNLFLYSSTFVACTLFQDNNVDPNRLKYAAIAMTLIKILHNTNLSVGIAKTETNYFFKTVRESLQLKYYIPKLSEYMLPKLPEFLKTSFKKMSPFVKRSCLFVIQSTSLAICGYVINENSGNLLTISQNNTHQLNLSFTQSRNDWFDKFLEILFFSFSNI
jgi:hypothetical protein